MGPRSSLVPAVLLASFLACGGPNEPRNHSLAPAPAVLPQAASLYAGQTLQFTLAGSAPERAQWSLAPPEGGAFTGPGRLTAAAPGTYTVKATVMDGTGRSSTATLTVLPRPATNGASPDICGADGALQTDSASRTFNAVIAGETFEPVVSRDPTGRITVHSGFSLPSHVPAAARGTKP